MLSVDDVQLVQRDSQVRGLSVLLDPDRLHETVASLWPDASIDAAVPSYVRYKAGTSCLVAAQLRVNGQTVPLYGASHQDPRKADQALRRHVVDGALGDGVRVVPEIGTSFHVFPNDHELRALRRLYDTKWRASRLRRIIPGLDRVDEPELEVLSYKPERRCVLKVTSHGRPVAVVRLYAESQFSQARERSWGFSSVPGLRVPPLIGDRGRYRALAHEWTEGLPAVDVLGSERARAMVFQLGEALLSLHGQRPNVRCMHSAGDFSREIVAACEAMRDVHPVLGERAVTLATRTASALCEHRWRASAIHGDLSLDQILILPDAVGILDFDRSGYGDPAIDLGSFIASLWTLTLAGKLNASRVPDLADALFNGYGMAPAASDRVPIEAFVQASLLQKVAEPFRRRCPEWAQRTSELLDIVERITEREAIDA